MNINRLILVERYIQIIDIYRPDIKYSQESGQLQDLYKELKSVKKESITTDIKVYILIGEVINNLSNLNYVDRSYENATVNDILSRKKGL